MELIERYVYVVTQRLPEAQRQDVAQELRATIQDMASDLARDERPTRTQVAAALEQLGDPRVLANRYAGAERYLVGPRWYEAYTMTLQRILALALPAIAVLTFIVQVVGNPAEIGEAIGRAIGGTIGVGLQILFWVTLVFAGLERAAPDPEALSRDRSRAGGWTSYPACRGRARSASAKC